MRLERREHRLRQTREGTSNKTRRYTRLMSKTVGEGITLRMCLRLVMIYHGFHQVTQLLGRELVALEVRGQFATSIDDDGMQGMDH